MVLRWNLAHASPTGLSLGSRSSKGTAQMGRVWAAWPHAVLQQYGSLLGSQR
jgi:hypothetical protein